MWPFNRKKKKVNKLPDFKYTPKAPEPPKRAAMGISSGIDHPCKTVNTYDPLLEVPKTAKMPPIYRLQMINGQWNLMM